MKRVKLRYFAVLRERRGLSEEWLDTDLTTAGQLVRFLIAEHRLGLPDALIRVAVANEFVGPDYHLVDRDEIVLVPPVAGG
ncbi:MAG: MoaD/ThiS family protein [Chthonomonas sp.]|nr:MoaD/ThiS family protein [Chthonomonas sp.]